ncbi:hypothetical protein P7H77_00600 [Lactococcus lactis]|uniref:hypothetical protein n=1 Tax=Lactococcus lactis TaxID=1358 RepID=UPI00288E30F1|nr:hypothetical protein [Lactococcus lactis]MDT2882846.1 hypothetical protein [Lactococcus lactis]MDT2971532.1 hypothetical protein [Lactococcus lactis]
MILFLLTGFSVSKSEFVLILFTLARILGKCFLLLTTTTIGLHFIHARYGSSVSSI